MLQIHLVWDSDIYILLIYIYIYIYTYIYNDVQREYYPVKIGKSCKIDFRVIFSYKSRNDRLFKYLQTLLHEHEEVDCQFSSGVIRLEGGDFIFLVQLPY